jgi:hypothetical protein
MRPSQTLSVSIRRAFQDVYDFAHRPENFPLWAEGLSQSLRQEGARWIADTPDGPAEVRFTPPNAYGVLDHAVLLPGRAAIYVPLRVIANGAGADVVFTLFRLPEMSDADFARDVEAVTRDLATLKRVLEQGS